MNISYEYDKEKNEILVECAKEFSTEDIEMYFEEILSKKNEISGAHEKVDFTGVVKFDSSFEDFSKISDLYAIISKTRIIVKTTFIVCNPYQYGMARMYSGLLSSLGHEYEYVYKKDGVDEIPIE